jgi:manganese transport protein
MTKKNKILIALSSVGPGLFLIGYNIGTGSVTTMAKTGAEHGMHLFWALVLSCIFTYILMVAYGKVTLVSGKTALTNIRNEFRHGWLLALYILAALIIGELLALMGVMGIVADLVQEGIRLFFNDTVVNRGWIILVLAAALYFLLWFGRYKTFEKVLTFFVILMGLSFLVVFIMVKPDFAAITSGLIPGIPNTPGAMGLVAAIAGTTCSAAVFIMRSTVVAEKGWDAGNLKMEKRDAFVSASMMLFLSAVIMAVAAGTLNVMV